MTESLYSKTYVWIGWRSIGGVSIKLNCLTPITAICKVLGIGVAVRVNTLILAFTGGSINTLILNYAYALRYNQVINMYEVGIEIMQGVSGSIAIILSVPLVSIVSACLLTFERKKSVNSEICYE